MRQAFGIAIIALLIWIVICYQIVARQDKQIGVLQKDSIARHDSIEMLKCKIVILEEINK